jgi:hypothetical protein
MVESMQLMIFDGNITVTVSLFPDEPIEACISAEKQKKKVFRVISSWCTGCKSHSAHLRRTRDTFFGYLRFRKISLTP